MTQEPETPATAIDAFVAYITQALIAECGEKHQRKIERCVEKKHPAILADLTQIYFSQSRHNWFTSNPDVKVMLSKTIERSWGRIEIDGKQRWLNALLSRYLFTTLHVGSNATQTASAVQFTKAVVVSAILEYVSLQQGVLLADIEMAQNEDADYCVISIDLPSLRHYIADVAKQLRTKSYVAELRKKLAKATHISDEAMDRIIEDKRRKLEYKLGYASSIVNSVDDNGQLWQEASTSAAGRLYLKGVNLQTAPKEVRHAALGRSVAYDMRCGALGVFAALANGFTAGELKFHAIKEYIQHRNEIRSAITRDIYKDAKHCDDIKEFYGYQKVKEAFTAIGFGARQAVGGSWMDAAGNWHTSALKEILGTQAEAFLTHRLAKDIIAEYALAAKVVAISYKHNDEFSNYLKANSHIDPAMTSRQLLAHFYQHFESVILNQFVCGATTQGATLLLPLHDGAYLNCSVDHQSIWWLMRLPFIVDKSFIQFERSKYVSPTVKSKYQQKDNEHKAFTLEQEKAAVNYPPRCAWTCEV